MKNFLLTFVVLASVPTFFAEAKPNKTRLLDEDELAATDSINESLGNIQSAQREQQKAPPPEQKRLEATIAANARVVDAAVAKFPNSSMVQEAGAQAALQVGDAEAAVRRAEQAVALAERPQAAPALLGRALTTRALALAAARDYPAAARDARRLLAVNPDDTAAQAILKLVDGRVRQAAPAGPPRPPDAALQALLDAARARTSLTRPEGFAASVGLTRRAETGLRLGDFEKMRRDASAALERLPDNPKAYMQRAFASLMLRRYDEAIADAEAGLKLRPDSYALLALRAAAQLETGRPREALADAERAVSLNPKDAFSRLQRGLAGERLGWPEEKYFADLKQAAELDPSFASFYTEALARRGLSSEAAPAKPVLPWWARPATLGAGLGALLLLLAAGAVMLLRPAADAPRGVVGGCFKLGEAVGAGGMGTVYKAWDTNLERAVAVKRMAPWLRDDEREAARFIREAKTVASLKHPNIVSIYDAFQDAGELYLVFELVSGPTLGDYLKSKGRLALPEALRILDPICEALDYAHGRGVIHRDLKPGNIMLEDGRPKIMDFGIARRTTNRDGRTLTDEVIGTPAFMAPEQRRGEVSRESDLYALAVCAYFLLAGRLPLEGPSGQGDKLDAIFARALHSDRDRRFRAAREFFDALRDSVPA